MTERMPNTRQRKRARTRRLEEGEGEGGDDGTRIYNFALIPKFKCKNSPFFEAILEGCVRQAKELGNVRCECIEQDDFPPDVRKKQELIIANVTARGTFDGIGVSVRKADDPNLIKSISDAVVAGIPVVTVSSDAPNSRRSAYIGTDNLALGRELGKVLKQLRPEGGKYALVSGGANNILEREQGFRDALKDTAWSEIDDGLSPMLGSNNGTRLVERMWELAENRSDLAAFVPLLGTPMNKGANWKEFATEFRDRVALVSTDWTQLQMDLLSQGYADGLVGQLPYEMGQEAVSNLYKLQDDKAVIQSEILGTNLIEILRVPLNLPPLEVDYNYLGNMTILGYFMFAIVAVLAIGFSAWTYINRHARVVKASQPVFLFLLCMGVLIFGSTIIVLGIDDENHSQIGCNIACQSVPWLFSVGFVLIFSVLFSKTWRVNRLFHNPNKLMRMKVTTKDVILPLILLMTVNVIVLVCWTVLSPLTFVRVNDTTTDLWNRPTTSRGVCKSTSDRKGKALPYIILIGLINLGALVMANVQAYIARDIQTEFSESNWIALVLGSILQATVIGVPIVILARNDPTVSYILNTVLVFVLSVVVLLFIFVPKYRHHNKWLAKQEAKKRRRAENSQATFDDSCRSDGSDGLRVMMKQAVYVRPGMKVSTRNLQNGGMKVSVSTRMLQNGAEAQEIHLELEEDVNFGLKEEDKQCPAKEDSETSPEGGRHVSFEGGNQVRVEVQREESGWQDNKSIKSEDQQRQEKCNKEELGTVDSSEEDKESNAKEEKQL